MQRFASRTSRSALHVDEDVGYIVGGPADHVLFQLPGPAACGSVSDDGTHVAYVPLGCPTRLYLLRHQGGTAWTCHILIHDLRICSAHWEEEGAFHTLRIEDECGLSWRGSWDGQWRLTRMDA